jgi:hypothetical protein
MGITAFKQQPTSEAVRAFLGRAIRRARATPKYLICDQGPQLTADGFADWCDRKGIKPRFGAIGQHGSLALVERLILTIKDKLTRQILVPYRRVKFLRELLYFSDWYNKVRPHMSLGGRTPREVYEKLRPANGAPRFEPRSRWPRASPCAKPQTLIKGQPGARLELVVTHHKGRTHLPVVSLLRGA